MQEKDLYIKSGNKLFPPFLFFLVLVLIAWFSGHNNRSGEICRVDGTGIIPITRVVLVDETGEESLFCSLCCAKIWLESHEELTPQLVDGKASLTVVDEISGKEIDVSLAYWVKSKEYSRQENRCQHHVFSDKQAASKYLRQQQGQELPGYLAGLGQQLSWAKDFTLEGVHGRLHSLSDYQGKIVFLRFWSLKNPFVATDLQNLQEAHDRFQEQDFTVVAVNVEDRREEVIKFVNRLALSFPVLLDPNGKIADQYQITGFPTGFLLDKSGMVDSSTIGELTADVLEPFLYSLR
jgi:peroxiredoxin